MGERRFLKRAGFGMGAGFPAVGAEIALICGEYAAMLQGLGK